MRPSFLQVSRQLHHASMGSGAQRAVACSVQWAVGSVPPRTGASKRAQGVSERQERSFSGELASLCEEPGGSERVYAAV